jgi:hypothetical protein
MAHPVHQRIASELRQRWYDVVHATSKITPAAAAAAATHPVSEEEEEEAVHPSILSLTDKHAAALGKAVALNKRVHCQTYDSIIREEVERKREERKRQRTG